MENPYLNQSDAYERLARVEARNMRVMTAISHLIKALTIGLLLFICLTWVIYFGVRFI